MADKQFELGDVVQVKSGGPQMTVSHVEGDSELIECTWFDKKQEPRFQEFPASTLKIYTPPKPVSF